MLIGRPPATLPPTSSTTTAAPVTATTATTTTTATKTTALQTTTAKLLTTTALTPASAGRVGAGGTAFDMRLRAAALVSGLHHPAFEYGLDRSTGSVARADNVVTPLFDGVVSFAERLRLIAGATSSIHLQTFIFTNDDTGWNVARHLAERARAGVEVRVMYDGLGSNRSGTEIFDFMRAAGVQVRARETGLDLLSVNDRWHEKHMVVDGKVAIEGGMNIADEYSLGGSGLQLLRDNSARDAWRDVDVSVEGPAVHDVQRAFLRNWSVLGAPVAAADLAALFPAPTKAPGGPAVRVVQHHPHGDQPDEHTQQLHVRVVNATSKRLLIENAYFLPSKQLRDALVDAAKRGVTVQVMTNSKSSSDMGFVVDASRYFYDELVDAGVQIFEKTGGTLHAKSLCADGVYSIIGSVNLNGRSEGRDTECAVGIRDEKTAAALEHRFTTGLAETKPVLAAELRTSSFMLDVKQWALSTLAWTL